MHTCHACHGKHLCAYSGVLTEDVRMVQRRSRAGLALSQDGKNWARIEGGHHTAAVMDAGGDGDWDSAFVGSPQVRWHLQHQSCSSGADGGPLSFIFGLSSAC